MRLSALFLRLGVFVLAAIFAVLAARATVAVVEDTSVVSVRETLIDRGLTGRRSWLTGYKWS